MGAHDSSFLRDASTSNSLAGNQYYNATVALGAGIRLLQGQVHYHDSQLRLCHTDCLLLDAGTLENWLSKIKFWLDDNPNEVITILLVNSDNKNASDFAAAFDGSGISEYGYSFPSDRSPTAPSPTQDWPTLQEMITSDKRVVAFIASLAYSPDHPYLLSEFDHVFENDYDVRSLSNFSCNLDRPEGRRDNTSTAGADAAARQGMMPLINHFAYQEIISGVLELPDVANIDTTNSPSNTTTGALGRHLNNCTEQYNGVKPVFVMVDFYDKGPAIEAADHLNGIVPTGRKASTSSANGASSGAASGPRWMSMVGVSERTNGRGGVVGVVALVTFLAVVVVVMV